MQNTRTAPHQMQPGCIPSRLIQHLVNNLGMNLAGVEHTLGMVDSLLRMKQRLARYAQSHPETGHMKEAVERELARVFQEMHLPVDD